MNPFFVHKATVETYVGRSGNGQDTYADPVTRKGFLDEDVDKSRTINADEVSSSTVWYTDLRDRALYVPGTRVTVNGRATEVLIIRPRSAPGLGLPEHLEVHLV